MMVYGDTTHLLVRQWAKTSIPNYFDIDQEKADKKILDTLKQGKVLSKTPVTHRDKNFASEMLTLADMSVCKHEKPENCICPEYQKVNIAKLSPCSSSSELSQYHLFIKTTKHLQPESFQLD